MPIGIIDQFQIIQIRHYNTKGQLPVRIQPRISSSIKTGCKGR